MVLLGKGKTQVIQYKQGDLLAENAEALVNTVNCVGVMGRGIALQFKKRFPDNYKFYEKSCKTGEVVPGKMLVYKSENLLDPPYIINFPTKRHWRGNSKVEDIENGLSDLVNVIKEHKIKSIAIPPLGCGLGGLEWSEIKPRMVSALSDLKDVEIIIYEPVGAPDAKDMVRNWKEPEMTDGRAAMITLIRRYLDGLLDPCITLLEIHKLMYFLQESGQKLRLKFAKAYYGPYAKNLSHVLNHMEGYMLSGYADGGDKPDKQIQLVPGADIDAYKYLSEHTETKERINRVANLINGFETPFGMELLSSVHWVVAEENATTKDAIITHIYNWDVRKSKFSHRQIEIAIERLSEYGWINTSITY